MTSSQPGHPTLISITPRFPVGDMEQALAFYAQLGFATTYRDGEFAIVEKSFGLQQEHGSTLTFRVPRPDTIIEKLL